ncbi:tetratricopeptide repeat protein [bacterium]|nr:tetratricopeptide repeat protein [bacterium]
MRDGFTMVIILFFLIIPLSSSYTAENKEVTDKKISDMKPDKDISEEHINSGDRLIENHQYEKALLDFKKALLYNPFSAKAYYRLGYCYKRLGLYDKAEKELNLGIKYERSLDSLTLLGIIYKYEGKYQQAKDLFIEVLATKPDNREVINYLEDMEKIDKELNNTANLK